MPRLPRIAEEIAASADDDMGAAAVAKLHIYQAALLTVDEEALEHLLAAMRIVEGIRKRAQERSEKAYQQKGW